MRGTFTPDTKIKEYCTSMQQLIPILISFVMIWKTYVIIQTIAVYVLGCWNQTVNKNTNQRLAAIIHDLTLTYPHILCIVSTGDDHQGLIDQQLDPINLTKMAERSNNAFLCRNVCWNAAWISPTKFQCKKKEVLMREYAFLKPNYTICQ